LKPRSAPIRRTGITRKRKKKSKNRVDTRGLPFAVQRDCDREPEWMTAFPDGREILNLETERGRAEYKARTLVMVKRQDNVCGCGCGELFDGDATFDHTGPDGHGGGRGLGGSRRDDRVGDEKNKKPLNRAVKYACNGRLGSTRY
jgi:hypothetical protein